MLKRPKPSDTEKDILQFQNEYLNEKRKDTTFQPSAKCVRLGEPSNTDKKQSIFAKSRKKDIQEKESRADKKPNTFVMGEIVERHPGSFQGGSSKILGDESFPKTVKIDISTEEAPGQSIFARLQGAKTKKSFPEMNFGEKSFIVTGSESSTIHEENVRILSQMSKVELKEERDRLIKTLDPKLLDFIRSQRRKSPQQMDVEETPPQDKMEIPPPVDILEYEERHNWLHFDKFEADKFQWMQNIPNNIPKLKPGETFEARFDWKGILLPYVDREEEKFDNRELYLHGVDPFRPGYTIQEFFRLARSNVTQQRIQALNAIAGVLRIYNQGFYDDISELPLTKIFFLLRFALDDSTVSVAEAAAKGLSVLFHNEIDELLLDTLSETQIGLIQPVFKETEKEDLEKNFSKMKINSSDLDEEMSQIEQMSDFYLAEVDLLKCLMRTNILKRIYFLIAYEEIPNTGVISLTHILIRICREGEGFAREVAEKEEILSCLRKKCLLPMNRLPDGSGKVQAVILKLMRVIVATQKSPAVLQRHEINSVLMDYCYTRRELNADFIQLQIQSYRLLRLWLAFNPQEINLSEFLPAIQMSLEWHYQFMSVPNGSAFLRQHAAAIVSLLNQRSFEWRSNICSPTLLICLKKWTTLFTQSKSHDLSQLILLTTCFELISRQPQQFVAEFVMEHFQNFLDSDKYSTLWKDLISTSPLIRKNLTDRSNIFNALPNLGGISFRENSKEPQLQIPYNYPGTFLLSVAEICLFHGKAFGLRMNLQEQVEEYFMAILQAKPEEVKTNWFYQHEIKLLLKLIQMDLADKRVILKTSLKVVRLLKGEENIENLKHLFSNVIFNGNFYSHAIQNELNLFNSTYWKFYSMNFNDLGICVNPRLTSSTWQKDLLPENWPLALLTIFLDQHISEKVQLRINRQIEDDILTSSMAFLKLLEENSLLSVNPSVELLILMMPFLSIECRFLDGRIKDLLRNRISSLFARCQTFNFALKLKDKHDFESIYTIFLNQFQSSSYGDDLFSAVALVPLAQKYDSRWRKMIWSEHIAVLRFVTCSEEQLCGSIDAYLEPRETDISLLKLYRQALNSNSLRKESIPYKIAQYHLKCLKC